MICLKILSLDVYAAGEAPIIGADGRALSRAIRLRGKVDPVFVEDIHELPKIISALVAPGDVILTMGAGNIGQLATQLPHSLSLVFNPNT